MTPSTRSKENHPRMIGSNTADEEDFSDSKFTESVKTAQSVVKKEESSQWLRDHPGKPTTGKEMVNKQSPRRSVFRLLHRFGFRTPIPPLFRP